MIQDPPGFLLDLDIINYILPRKDGSLFLDNSRSIRIALRSLSRERGFLRLRFFVGRPMLEFFWDTTSLENEDFTFGSFRGDEF